CSGARRDRGAVVTGSSPLRAASSPSSDSAIGRRDRSRASGDEPSGSGMRSYAHAVADRRVEGSLVSVGYEGREASELIDHLRSLDVSVVVDVRLNAISRKRGLSKTALREALE